MAQQTQINGNRYSFVHISLSANGLFAGQQQLGGTQDQPRGCIQAINYAPTLDAGWVQGNQIAPVGRTPGFGTGDGSLEVLLAEFDTFAAFLTQNGTYPLMQVDFNLAVSFSVNDIDTRTDELLGCRITKIDSNHQKGNDASTKVMTLSISRIKFNGVDAYADPVQ